MGGGSPSESSLRAIGRSHETEKPKNFDPKPRNASKDSSMSEAGFAPSGKPDEDLPRSPRHESSIFNANGSNHASTGGDSRGQTSGKFNAGGQGVNTVASSNGKYICNATFGKNNTGQQYEVYMADGAVDFGAGGIRNVGSRSGGSTTK